MEEAVLPTLRRLGIGLVAYSPLGRGFLTGGIRNRSDLQQGDWRLSNPRFSDEALAANLVLVDEIERLAEAKKVLPAQLALAWVLSQGTDIAAIPGTRRIERLEQNVAAAGIQLSEDEVSHLSALAGRGVVGSRY